jgi:hypothetical protein
MVVADCTRHLGECHGSSTVMEGLSRWVQDSWKSGDFRGGDPASRNGRLRAKLPPVCTEHLIRVDDVVESLKLAK